jgi:dihydroorotate dehydrogenase (fumarate)
MTSIHRLTFDPPLINSASPWASSFEDLQALYDSPFTGGVTTRTATMEGFDEDPNVHRVCDQFTRFFI